MVSRNRGKGKGCNRSLGMIWPSVHVTQKDFFYVSNTLGAKMWAKLGQDRTLSVDFIGCKRSGRPVEDCIPIAGQNNRKSVERKEHFWEKVQKLGVALKQSAARVFNWAGYAWLAQLASIWALPSCLAPPWPKLRPVAVAFSPHMGTEWLFLSN